MTTPPQTDAGGAPLRLDIEALVGAYPNIADEDLSRLLHWFKREATSFDVAMLSGREDIRQGYERFRTDHIDRISHVAIVALVITVLVISGVIYWLAPGLKH